MESSSESFSSIGGVDFVFCFAGGSAAEDGAGRSGRSGGGALLGVGRTGGCGRGGGPCAECKVPKTDAGCRNMLHCGDACVIPCDWFNNSWNPGVCVKVACLLTDSIYALAVSDRGRIGMDVLDFGFTGIEETIGGDGIAGARSAGRGRVLEIVIGTEIGVSRTIVGTGAGVGTSSDYALLASLVLALDPGACLSLDSADSWLVLRVVGVWRFCNTSVGGRFENSKRSGTFSSGMGLPRKKWFRASKKALISAKIVSILAE